MQLSNTHASNLNIIMRLGSPLTDSSQLHINIIVDLSAKLRILIQISNVRLSYIYRIKYLIFLFYFFLLVFGYLVIILLLWDEF